MCFRCSDKNTRKLNKTCSRQFEENEHMENTGKSYSDSVEKRIL